MTSERRPTLRAPQGATDCHVHVYGPNSDYTLASTRTFDVPEALPANLAGTLDRLGIDRVVLVQPSGYGIDNRRHLDAMREVGRPARMIAALRADTPDAELDAMHEAGVRGVRYTIGHAGAAPLTEMPILAERIKRLGWHVQLHVMNDGGGAPLADMESTLARLPVDVVIDHLGSLRASDGVDQQGFQALLRLVGRGRTWVKLSAGYRLSNTSPPYSDLVPFVQALLEQNANHLLWGSDWPHVSFEGSMPDTADLLDQMNAWIPDTAVLEQILVENPAERYGF
ncbi:amidohydrolase family protein [Pigmentiphaga litoralis]|uniref:amidohydrolase family protein n=1 Tax=Pigmentiphaga litoralis TaxID=516702 RepID=UPI003B435A8B